MKSKTYLHILFLLLGSILVLAIAYALYFSKHYPLPVTGRISLDAKLKFIREHINPNQVDTLIIGSSIGMNNIQGSHLERRSATVDKVLNLSVYGATTLQTEQLMQLADAFPNLKRILYSVQYPDTTHEWKFKDYNPIMLRHYMRHELNPIQHWLIMFHSCRNLFFCINRQQEWKLKHMQTNKFEYLGFDSTGSVPLHIYGKDIIGHRWMLPQPGIMSPRSFQSISRMAQNAHKKGILFYVVHQPYREPLYQKHENVRGAMAYFDKKATEAIASYDGIVLKMQPLHLGDSYFSDRTHLNDKGSKIVTEELAKIIDTIERKEEK